MTGITIRRKIMNALLDAGLVPKRLRASYLVREKTGGTIAGGPFFGMRYVENSVGSEFHAKLLGTYEMELRDIVESLCSVNYDWIVDVGAAEGYYAVGMAIRCPRAKVVAFESLPEGRELLQELADLNGVATKIEIKGHCDAALLQQQFAEIGDSRTLVIMDIEGYELVLLDPKLVPELKTCDILVEIHDGRTIGPISHAMEERFKSSHRIERVWAEPRVRKNLPKLGTFWTDLRVQRLMNEGRSRGLAWLYMKSLRH